MRKRACVCVCARASGGGGRMGCAFRLRLGFQAALPQGGRFARENACVSVFESVYARAPAVEIWGAPSGSAWVFQPRLSHKGVCVCARAPAEVGVFADMLHGLHATQSTCLYMHGGCTCVEMPTRKEARDAHECIDQHMKETCFTRKRVWVMWTTVQSAVEQMRFGDMVHITHGTLGQALTCTVVGRVC